MFQEGWMASEENTRPQFEAQRKAWEQERAAWQQEKTQFQQRFAYQTEQITIANSQFQDQILGETLRQSSVLN